MGDQDSTTINDGAAGPAHTPTLSVRSGERYRLGALIGKGGMGDVIAATDLQLGREVAIKRMKMAHPSDHAMARFFREASVQGRLDHPAIVPVHELGVDEAGQPFFVMKRLAGTTLADHIAQGTGRERLLRAFADICLAIEFAHARGVVHRDLKPHNIVLGDFGEVYVLDWGVARIVGESDDAAPDEGDPELTADGTIIGTPGYMSPEQARGASDVDGRADVYALGCTLYEILARERLHPRGPEGLRSVLAGRDSRPSLRTADVAPELDALCVAATAVDRASRIQTARELGDRVQRYLDGDRDLATRKERARVHFEAARAALADGDDQAARRIAMREAGRALALDPALVEAADLVGRLMLEPPREMPPEVERELADEDLRMQRHRARAALWGHLGYVPLVSVIVAVGAGWYALALVAALAFNVVMIIFDLRRDRRVPFWLVLAGAVSVIAVVACMFSPFLIAPALAAVTGMFAAQGVFTDSRRSIVLVSGALIAAILLPLFGEWLGILPTTVTVEYGILHYRPPGLAGPPAFLWASGILYAISLIVSCVAVGRMMRGSDRGSRRQLHLQAWQLRQLMATS